MDDNMTDEIDETLCPFCKTKNKCMAHVEEPCWCNTANVPKELIAIAPEEARGKVCICLSCIQLFKNDPSAFEKFQKNSHAH